MQDQRKKNRRPKSTTTTTPKKKSFDSHFCKLHVNCRRSSVFTICSERPIFSFLNRLSNCWPKMDKRNRKKCGDIVRAIPNLEEIANTKNCDKNEHNVRFTARTLSQRSTHRYIKWLFFSRPIYLPLNFTWAQSNQFRMQEMSATHIQPTNGLAKLRSSYE